MKYVLLLLPFLALPANAYQHEKLDTSLTVQFILLGTCKHEYSIVVLNTPYASKAKLLKPVSYKTYQKDTGLPDEYLEYNLIEDCV